MLRILLAAIHLLALGIGLGAVLTRGTVLRGKLDAAAVRLAMRYDMLWGISAILWISTGLWRYLASTEKATSYYNGNHLFLTKMVLLLLILILEVTPARTIAGWRKKIGAGGSVEDVVNAASAQRVARISHMEAGIIVVMVNFFRPLPSPSSP
jgi:putative membrane protein